MLKTTTRLGIGLYLLCSLAGLAHADEGDAERPPNVVLVFTDDQGYGDVGVYGAKDFETPNLDRLAAEGMRFTSFYVSEATCSASRASLLTGCYAQRVSMATALMPSASVGLHPDEETIAELLKARGYATGAIGKWHLGHLPPFLPPRQGFDEYLGLPYSNDMWPVEYDGVRADQGRKLYYPELPLLDGEEQVAEIRTLADQDTLTTRYTKRALDFIERNRDRPFFLYLAHSMPHVPLGVSDRFRGQSEQGMYGDVIMEIDDSVGQVLAALEKHGLTKSTIVIFVTDNGPWLNFGNHAGSTGGLREGKGTAWEGGARVPCLVRWPGHVPAGAVCSELAATIDLLPTIAEITGAKLPKREIDGVSVRRLLSAETKISPRKEYLYFYGSELRAVRDARYKLVLPHSSRSYVGVEPGQDGMPGPYATWKGGPLLFDLIEDPAETTDVSEAHPEIVARLQARAEHARTELGDRITKRRGRSVRPIGRVGPEGSTRVLHLAKEKAITLAPPPSPTYPASGPAALIDGIRGTLEYDDGTWQGFEGTDLEAVIDLGAVQPLTRVACTYLESQAVWIFLPKTVEVSTSTNGTEWAVLGREVTQEPTFRRDASVRTYRFDATGRSARFVRVRAQGLRTCPDWHPGTGLECWIFADEIVVR